MPISSNPQDIRERIKLNRRSLDSQFSKTAEQQLTHHLIATALYQNNQYLAAYIAVNGECDLRGLIDHALNTGKHIYLPIMTNNKILKFSPYTHNTPLQINKFGIPEPTTNPQTWINADQLDLICVPLVAFDAHCNRLGMGGGYYDRTLMPANKRNRLTIYLGIGFEFQKVEHLCPEPWDIPMDFIVTEQQFYSRV